MKTPYFAMSVRSSGPAGLQLRPVLLRCLNSLGTTASFLGLSKTMVHYVPARPCQSIAIRFVFHILTIPYMLSPANYCYIRHASLPLMPIKGVRGIYPFYHPNTKRQKRDVCTCYGAGGKRWIIVDVMVDAESRKST